MSTGTRNLNCRQIPTTGSHHPEKVSSSTRESSAVSTQMDDSDSTHQGGKMRNKECRNFKAGRCMKGDKCRWNHEPQAKRGPLSNHKNETRPMNVRKGRVVRKAVEEQHKAHLETARKAKQIDIAEHEANVVIKQIVMNGSTLVTCGAGLDIRHIVCGFESRFITIKNLPRDVKPHEIEELFTQQGVDTTFFCVVKKECVNDQVEAKVMLDFDHYQAIVAVLDGMEFQGKFLDAYANNEGVPNKMDSASEGNINTFTISWKLPPITMVAQYATTEDAQDAVKKLNNTIFGGQKIWAKVCDSSSVPSYAPGIPVRISGLSKVVTTEEVKKHSDAYLVRSFPPPFETKELEIKLEQILRRKKGFEYLDIDPVNPDRPNVEARARFRTWDDAKGARDSLERQKLGSGYPRLRLWLPKPIQYVITIPLLQYNAQRGRWGSLPTERTGKIGAFVQVTKSTNKAFIRVLGEDKKAVGQLKVRVESLVAGETLDPRLWHRSFMGAPGQRLLNRVNTRSKAYIRADWKSKTLKLYADGNARQAAINLIRIEIARLESSEWSKPIDRRAIRFFMRKGLHILKEEFGEDAATLELLPTPRLIIRSGEEVHRTVDRLIEESRMNITSKTKDSRQDMCPICFDEVASPVMLSCGHVYCNACVRHFLLSATERKAFPLICSGNEDRCKAPIAIPIIQRYLLPQQFDQLVEAAVTTYIEKQPTIFRYCMTPDCPQVYRFQGTIRTLTCPSCFATVCTGCHKEAHEGMTCREKEIMNDPERLNDEWAQAEGAKRCPSCRVWIQKTEGCNHMTCQCGAHLCWICLETFSNSQGAYAHLQAAHGGIHDDGAEGALLEPEVLAWRLLAEEYEHEWFGLQPQAQDGGGAWAGGQHQVWPLGFFPPPQRERVPAVRLAEWIGGYGMPNNAADQQGQHGGE